MPDPKDTLVTYLQSAREAMLWKLDGLGEYDVRRPLTRTGTNLLGLVKHLASIELGYFGETFGRPHGVPLPWLEPDAELNADMWVPENESRDSVVALYHRAWEHAAGTFAVSDLDTEGRVPWWPAEEPPVTLHQILVHVTTETYRHAGHADVVRELVDGAAGRRPDDPNLDETFDWPAYVARVEEGARRAGQSSGPAPGVTTPAS